MCARRCGAIGHCDTRGEHSDWSIDLVSLRNGGEREKLRQNSEMGRESITGKNGNEDELTRFKIHNNLRIHAAMTGVEK